MTDASPEHTSVRRSLLGWDRVCDRFEAAWKSTEDPRLEDYLVQRGDQEASEALADLLTIELTYRRWRGEWPREAEYNRRFPAQAEFLRGFFLAYETMTSAGMSSHGTEPKASIGESGNGAPRGEPPLTATLAEAAVDEAAQGFWIGDPGPALTRQNGAAGSAPFPDPPLPRIPGFRLLGLLGRGGMGVVYLARNLRLERICAIKMISAAELADREQTARFLAEATTLARLRHPGIVQVHHVGDHAGRPYVELEYVEGGSLSERLNDTPWPPERAARLIEALAVAIHEAHCLGIVHRDLKPGNILLTGADQPKITDFGLARLLAGGSDLTRSEAILGTPSYMAPEQASGHARDVGPPADVHALGAILYELLTGGPPFRGANAVGTLEQVKTVEPVPPGRRLPSVPRDLETICLTCLQKEPRRRYRTAGALADDLRRYSRNEPISARRISRRERVGKWCRRNPTRASLAAVSTVLLVLLTVGPLISLLVLLRERDRVRLARLEAAEQRREALAAQAYALRQSDQPGRRFEALSLLAEAAQIRPGADLRDQAIACMALFDVRPGREWTIQLPSFSRPAVDWQLERYAVSDDQGQLAIRSLQGNRPLQALPGTGKRCQSTEFSPDGKFLAALHDDHEFRCWDLAQGVALSWITGEITCWAFSPDGRWIAIGRGDNSVTLHHPCSGQAGRSFALDEEPASMDFSPDGRTLAVAWGTTVELLEPSTGRHAGKLDHHPAKVRSVRWGGKGRLLATVCDGPILRVWEKRGWKLAWTQQPVEVESKQTGSNSEPEHLAFHPDGDVLAVDWIAGVRLLNAWSGEMLLTIPGFLPQGAAAFSPDGARLMGIDGARSQAVLWEIDKGTEFRQLVSYAGPDGGHATAIDFHPGDHLLALGERRGSRLIDPDTATDLAWLNTGSAESVRFRPTGEGLVTVGLRGLALWPVRFHDDAQGRHHVVGPFQMHSPRTPTLWASRAEWVQGGRFLAWSDWIRGEVIIEDLEGDRGRRVLSGIPALGGLSVSPDGRWLATWPWRGKAIEVRDLDSGQILWSRRADVGHARFSPDGRVMACTLENTVALYEAGTWRLQSQVSCPGAGTMAFHPEGSVLAVNAAGGVIRLLDTASGRTLGQLQNPTRLIDPFQLAFSSDGKLLAMANGRGGVQVWDISRVRGQLRKIGLDWDWTGATPGEPPVTLATLEAHDGLTEAMLAEHEGEWEHAIGLRTRLIAASVHSDSRLRRGHCQAQLRRWNEAVVDFDDVARTRLEGCSLGGIVGSLGGASLVRNSWRPVPGRWAHLALTFDDSDGVVTVYNDGAVLASHRVFRPPGYGSNPLLIGANPGSGQPLGCFEGLAAGLRLWGVARSQVQIQATVRGVEPPDLAEGLVARWEPGQAGSRTLRDTSGHDHHGRLGGTVSTVMIDQASVPPGLAACRSALLFQGGGSHVEVADALPLRPRSFTLEGWFNFSRDDRGCWLFCRRVGGSHVVSMALRFDNSGSGAELEARHAEALALLVTGDHAGYRRLCGRLLEQYGETTNAVLASEMVHLLSLGPAVLDEYGPAVALAERAVATRGGHDALSSLGAILYRAGRFTEAVGHLRHSASNLEEHGAPRDQLFLAMAYHALGDDHAARAELMKTEESIPRILLEEANRRENVRWPDDWMTPTELKLLRTEADRLLMDAGFPEDPFQPW